MLTPSGFFESLIDWGLNHGIKIAFILVVVLLIDRFGIIFVRKIIKRTVRGKNEETEKKREDTLRSIFTSTFRFMVWVIAVATVLPELGVNIAPLLAGAGLVGLAVGMGARSLIQDYLSGVFIIMEDQYKVGDRVKIAGVEGEVKHINLRRTILRDGQGVIHSIPNGEIKVSSNQSKR